CCNLFVFFFSSRRRHTRFSRDWSSDVCSSDLVEVIRPGAFDETLAEKPDVSARVQHQGGLMAIGRTTNGTLRLKTDKQGLQYERSEERRVGKECRCRGVAVGETKTGETRRVRC